MTMSLARGLTTLNTKKPKTKKLTQKQLEQMRVEWRQYNKDMRRKNMSSLQWEDFDDYLAYRQGKAPNRNKVEKEFKTYAPTQPYVRNTTQYRSLETSDKIPGYAAKREPNVYTGTLIKGIGTMHKSNAVPIIDKKQAEELAQMRRN